MPNVELLERFDLKPFIDIRNAVTSGNLLKLNESLEVHQTFFIKTGIYLILEKLKVLTYRNLFKKTSLLLATHQLPIEVSFIYTIQNRIYIVRLFNSLIRSVRKFQSCKLQNPNPNYPSIFLIILL